MMVFARRLLALGVALMTIGPATAATAADPVADFIAEAEGAWRTGGEDALREVVAHRPLLIGAAVAQLIDVAVDLRNGGEPALADENVTFAQRVARLHADQSGSQAPGRLVKAYLERSDASWSEFDRAKQLESQAAEANSAGDPALAIQRLTEAITLYAQIGALHEEAEARGTLGVYEWARGDMAAVRAAYEEALVARRAVEDRILEGRTLNGLGSACFQLGEYQNAIDFYQQAKELRQATGDRSGLGTTLTYLGNTYYVLGELVLARKHFEQALPILESQGQMKGLSELYTSIGNLHSTMGRYDEAAHSYAKVIEIAQQIEAPDGEMLARINYADNLRQQGRFRAAIAELELAQALLDEVSEPTLPITLHRTRGLTFSMVGDLDRAREDLVTALQLSQESGLPDLQIEAFINLGELYRSLLANDRAMDAAEKAIALATTQAAPRRYREANALAGDVARELGDLEKARHHWSEALAQDEADGARATIPLSEVGLANVEAVAGESEKARDRYRRAMIQLASTGQHIMTWVPLLGIAHTFEREQPDSAAIYYDLALDALEAGRMSDAAVGTGFVRADRGLAYEGVMSYFASNWLSGGGKDWMSRAFSVAERVKARGLLDLVQGAVPAGRIPGMDALLDSLYSVPDDPQGRQRRFRLEEQMAALRDRYMNETLGRAPAPAAPLALDEVVKRMPEDAVLLEYALGDSASFLWIVDRKESRLVELAPRAELTANVQRLRGAIAAQGGTDDALRQTARTLYQSLVEPATDRLRRAKTAVIVPDGVLFDLPFEVLLMEDAAPDAPWGDLRFLGSEKAVVYAPSATIWLDLRGRSSPRAGGWQLLAVGDPSYSEASGLAPLPYSRAEVEAIGAFVGTGQGRILLGPQADESAVKAELRERSPKVLHLAAHGLIDAAEPSRSSIALALPPAGKDDGYLYSLEVLSLSLHDALVVLSACESARGRVQGGEGVVGLTRSFLGAGAGGVIASLWPVSDESTSVLMQDLYRGMFEKKRPAAESLQAARVAMLGSGAYAHPFHWAAFVMVGSDRSPW